MFKRAIILVFLIGSFAPFPGSLAKPAKKVKKKPALLAVPTPSPTSGQAALRDEIPTVTPDPTEIPKTFNWYFKKGCNCPQCRAFRKNQEEENERLKNNFQP